MFRESKQKKKNLSISSTPDYSPFANLKILIYKRETKGLQLPEVTQSKHVQLLGFKNRSSDFDPTLFLPFTWWFHIVATASQDKVHIG